MPAIAEPPATSAVPSSKGVIHVTAGGMSATPTAPATPEAPAAPSPTTPAKTPTARENIESSLTKKIKPGTGPAEPPAKAVEPPAQAPTEEAAATEETAAVSETPPAPKPGEVAAKPAKVNPWKLADEHKARAAKLEQQVVELQKLVPNEAARKSEMAEIEQIKTRAKELEDEIRYVNYSKSPEFKTKYQEPYEKAWSKAMSELKEITVQDPASGEQRAVTPNDMLELVNAPLGRARELANTLFGDFADDVMAHRKEIKNLFEAQATALEEARVNGAEREKTQQQEFQSKMSALQKEVADTWTQANEAALRDEKYGPLFTPVEGDQDGNQRLAKGYELVDRAFKENPMDPKLTPEERASVIKRHAAVRNRAAGFGRLLAQKNALEARVAELLKELEQFKGSTPTTAGGPAAKPAAAPADARSQMEAALAKLAKAA